MALAPRLELRQSQSLVMTPQLQQAIKLLQMSNLEIVAYVEQELEQNPLLEKEESYSDADSNGAGEAIGGADEALESAAPTGEAAADGDAEDSPAMDFARDGTPTEGAAEALDADEGDLWESEAPLSAAGPRGDGPIGGGFDEAGAILEQTLSEKVSLRDHLTCQLHMGIVDPQDRLIGIHLIDMLDEAGYLAGDVSHIADLLGCSLERVIRTLEIVQQFDPPGVFARNLAECLRLQLRDRDRLDPAMETLLDHLDLVGRRDFAALTRLCGVDHEDLADMLAEIRALDPKPALAFEPSVAQPVTPDIFMRPKGGGGWAVELNSDTLPRVLVNNQYYAEVSRGMVSKDDKRYISDCFQSATWLVKSLHQRATTILKVAVEIVRQQEAFFAHGVKFLKPLILRDISAAIEMHESTVSRVTTNKYMATPRGIYELKYFFTPALGNTLGGASHSAESVRYSIKALIEAEPADNVLSDDKIVEILRQEGMEVARRTVAKYREAMRISSSVQRRREKAGRASALG